MNTSSRIVPVTHVVLGAVASLAVVLAAFASVGIDRALSAEPAPLRATASTAQPAVHHAMLLAPSPQPGEGEPELKAEDLPQSY